MPEALKKALLEGLRVIVIAILPILISSIESGMVDFRLLAMTGSVAFLRFVDKWIHEIGKESGDDRLKLGLTRF
jgi:hypothetical protein